MDGSATRRRFLTGALAAAAGTAMGTSREERVLAAARRATARRGSCRHNLSDT